MINNQDISAIGAELLSQRAAQHKEQLTQMRKLRSRLKAACNLTEEELAACGVRVKKNEHAAGGITQILLMSMTSTLDQI